MDADDNSDLQLLLCDGSDGAPVLEEGLSESALSDAQAPEQGPRGKDSMLLEALHRDPNDLGAQRWAVIAPEGAEGDRRLAAIAELIDHRRAQQGAKPRIYRVPPAMDAFDSLRWKNDVLRSEEVALDERPRYLLILGDLHEVSLELQHVLANGSFVGRLHCPTIQGIRAYAEKVVRHERAPLVPRARPLYYTAQDGTAAVGIGYRHLIEPCMRMTRDLNDRGKLDANAPEEIPYSDWGPDELLAMTSAPTPSMLLSLSHGLGAPRRGWRSPDEQRALQGALAIGPDGPLAAEMVEETPFLPGGVWMCVACFAAGTPPHSAYHPWLSLLAEHGGASGAALAAVLRSLPQEGERPFVAALPQALLANPEGPLAVIGHMDLAWTYGFSDPKSKRSRASRMLAAQRAILSGARVGVGLDALMHAYRETNDELTARYQLQRDARARGRADPVTPRQLGTLWMQRNDLRGYVLLGDPATRLGITGQAPLTIEAAELAETTAPSEAAIDLRTTVEEMSEFEPMPDNEPDSGSEQMAGPETESQPESQPERQPARPPQPTPEPATEPTPLPQPAPPPAPAASSASTVETAAQTAAQTKTPQRSTPPNTGIHPTHREPPMEHEPPTRTTHASPPTSSAPPASATSGAPPVETAAYPSSPPAPAQPPSNRTASAYGGAPVQPPAGAAPYAAVARPRTIENPEIALRERAVLAMLRGDEAPRSIASRFGLPLEEIFYWLDVYREAGRRALAG